MLEFKVFENISIDELGVAELNALDAAVEGLAVAARDKWISLAQTKLKSARTEYINGLSEQTSFQQTGRNSYEISLVGRMPNKFEAGFDAYDMKPGLLGGGAAKISKDGKKYNTVPFRHYPGAKAAERVSKVPNYKQDLKRVLAHSGLGRIQKGVSGKVGKPADTRSLGIAKLRAHHKTDIYHGMTQYQKVYEKKTGQQLMTFRRVSEKSDPAAWLHPGYKGAHLMPEVGAFVEEQMGLIVSTIMGGA